MIKTLQKIMKQDKERFVIPKGVQQAIPIRAIWPDGIFRVGSKFSKSFRFEDINYAVASKEDKEAMFLSYSELLNSFDSGATTKITVNNRRLNKTDFESSILIPLRGNPLDEYRMEYNRMLIDKATGANSIVQDKYVTVSVAKKNIEEAHNYFSRIGTDLITHFSNLGSKCVELDTSDRLRIFHDFFRAGEETDFHFDLSDTMRKGHDFKDYICPDTFEFEKDHFRMGGRFGRVIFLREYASYIRDSMVSELCDLNRNMLLSLDIIPIPTDEAVREVENRLLGVETNITNWQRRQNSNNNFSAVVPYDMEQQRKESKEFLDDLTTRDQRMMFAVLTMVHIADSKEQLDSDTETLLTTARKHLCQFSTLTYQQIKAGIAAVKNMIALIIAGGWVVVVTILAIYLAGLLLGSVFGVFYSNESSDGNTLVMTEVVSRLNNEFTAKLDQIKNQNPYDELEMSGNGSGTINNWREILAVYTIKVAADLDNSIEVATLDDAKVDILRGIFWNMNEIDHWIQTVDHEETITATDKDGNETKETVTATETVLHINIISKSHTDMIAEYAFNTEQVNMLNELMQDEYKQLFMQLIGG